MSCRELAELACRRGDIDSRRGAANVKRMLEGAEIHRRYQAEMCEKFEEFASEVRCENVTAFGGVSFSVSGNADCFFRDKNGYTVEEIKTFASGLPRDPMPEHIVQLYSYAYFLCVARGLDSINAKLTYICAANDKREFFEYNLTSEELLKYYEARLASVLPRANMLVYRAEVLLPSVKTDSLFPFEELRPGQSELVTECFRTIKAKKRLFAQAPTGTGKTLSTLYPAVRALGAGHCDRIFYLTAKASTGHEAYSAAKKLFESGAKLKTAVISAREKCCLCETAKASGRISSYCNPIDCPYARGYYDRADGAIFSLLSGGNGYSRIAIEKAAKQFSVCPYELSLDLSEFCDIIICDYNYAFDPAVYLRRYFGAEAERADNVFLIDEAHNLPDRVRSMYSCRIGRREFETLYAATGETEPELDAALESVIRYLRGIRRLCKDNLIKTPDGERGFYMSREKIPGLYEALDTFAHEADAWKKNKREHRLYPAVTELASKAKKYMLISDYYDEKFLSYVELMGGDTAVQVYCLDPSGVLGERLSRASASVLFSATLTPLEYFTELCGAKGSFTLDLPSPFPEENLCVAAVDTISTKSDDRDDRTCRKIATYIAATVSAKAGNYICYFPSYSFMEKVLGFFTRKYPDVETVVQTRGMSFRDRENFLSAFKNDSGVLRIGFCVLGGSFSEGVDLPGKRLIGSIVIGAGIPGISNERNILKDYYDLKTDGMGYDYAYTFPGMNAVLQAAGRVIRKDDDKGIVVLIDDRYGTPRYASLFPEQWSGLQFAGNPSSLAEIARRFWKKSNK